jgi:hypothetical protein
MEMRMTDILSSGLSASLAVSLPQLAGAAAPAPLPEPEPAQKNNVNAPAFISPAISFDPVTNIVFLTFRNPVSGKVTQQVPPSEVLDRYRTVDETGIPNPNLPPAPPDPTPGVDARPAGEHQAAPPPEPKAPPASNSTKVV